MLEETQGPLSILLILLLMAGVIFLAYWATKLVGQRFGGQLGGSSRHIKVLDRVPLGQDKALLLVQVADKTMVLGAAQHRIEKLCDIDSGALQDIPEPTQAPFSAILSDALQNLRGARGGKGGRHE